MSSPPPPSSSPFSPGSPSSPSSSGSPGESTLTGQVVEGVEVGCLLLDTGAGEYLLVIPQHVDRSAVRAGARLVVRGRVEPGLVSYCQQGTPFVVSDVRPA